MKRGQVVTLSSGHRKIKRVIVEDLGDCHCPTQSRAHLTNPRVGSHLGGNWPHTLPTFSSRSSASLSLNHRRCQPSRASKWPQAHTTPARSEYLALTPKADSLYYRLGFLPESPRPTI